MPNIARNCIVNIGEIVVYDVCKEALLSNRILSDGIPCHFTAAVMAGFCATLVASPVDVIKTRWKTQAHTIATSNCHLCPVVKERDIRLFLIPWAKVKIWYFPDRFMNSPKGRYRGAMGCAMETAKNEGFFAFYKGFNASFTRLVAWNICLWITYEQFKKGVLQFYNESWFRFKEIKSIFVLVKKWSNASMAVLVKSCELLWNYARNNDIIPAFDS